MVFALACLPFEMAFSLDAIARTAFRMLISRRHLLQWTPSSSADRQSQTSLFTSYETMWISPMLAIGTFIFLVGCAADRALVDAVPLIALWLFAPGIEAWLSRPVARVDVAARCA